MDKNARQYLKPSAWLPPLLLALLSVLAMVRLHNVGLFFLPALAALGHGLYRMGVAPLWRQRKPMALFFLFALYAGISVFWAAYPQYALREFKEDFAFPVLGFVTALFLGGRLRFGFSPRLFLGALWTFFILASFISWLRVGPGWIERYFESVGYYSTYCFLMAGVTVPFLGGKARLLFYGVLAACLYISAQRIAWIVFPLICMADALCHGKRLSPKTWLAIGAGALVFSYAMMSIVIEKRPVNAFDQSKQATGVISHLLANERLVRWGEWLELGARKAWGGTGYGRENALRTLSGGEAGPINDLFHAHNVFINVFVQLGLLGILLFTSALLRLLAWLRTYGRDPSAQAAALVLLLFTARNMVDDFSFGRVLMVFAILLGASLARIRQAASQETERVTVPAKGLS